ncbi:hypothetical protein [Anianabacter salinae]|uniref:hypothetical protein n=1 Tax=Anianabacter salinae TaxID=2851023 RepID=UPI00225E5FB3|nr:hypothetical protein [Anianabacter salinae]
MRLAPALTRLLAVLALVLTAACGGPAMTTSGRPPVPPTEIEALTQAFLSLSPEVDPAEAARAARLAYRATDELAVAYQITDGPIIHNTKVNMGIKPRGLCWHWAEDMENYLLAEGFQTLSVHRAIANADNAFRLEHSTAIISARGAGMYDGIVLDPWRKGGVLTWVPVRIDTDYGWVPQLDVLESKGLVRYGPAPPGARTRPVAVN